jgi:hypothetical protein
VDGLTGERVAERIAGDPGCTPCVPRGSTIAVVNGFVGNTDHDWFTFLQPRARADRPDPELLRWHNEHVFGRAA